MGDQLEVHYGDDLGYQGKVVLERVRGEREGDGDLLAHCFETQPP